MDNLHPEALFALEGYQHRALFANCRYAWEALANIVPYFSSLSYGQSDAIISPQAILINPESIYIGPYSVVEAGAYIQGPCIIGNHCVIRHGAYIRGHLITGDHCVIGGEVKNAIFLNDAKAAHFAYVGDSILGNGVNLGAGVKLANLKFNNSTVVINDGTQKHFTGLRKCGAIIGDGAQIGCNCVTQPGTVLGRGAIIFPTICFGGVAPANSKIQSTATITINPSLQNRG